MKKRFARTKRKSVINLDITSLLDILTILLVFLLKNYSGSDFDLNLVKDLQLPNSDSKAISRHAPVVQVNKNGDIFINNRIIGRFPASEALSELSTSLKHEKAKAIQENIKLNQKRNPDIVNLVFDKELNYETVKQVMRTSSLAGYSQYKFIVRSTQ